MNNYVTWKNETGHILLPPWGFWFFFEAVREERVVSGQEVGEKPWPQTKCITTRASILHQTLPWTTGSFVVIYLIRVGQFQTPVKGSPGSNDRIFFRMVGSVSPSQALSLFDHFFFSATGLEGAVVTQFPRHRIVGTGKELTLQCLQDMNYVLMYWYHQDPGFGLRLIYYSTGARNFEKGDVPQGYRVSQKDLQPFSLTLESASTNQTSDYLCTSSEPQRGKDVSSLRKKGASQGGRGPRLQESWPKLGQILKPCLDCNIPYFFPILVPPRHLSCLNPRVHPWLTLH